MNNRKGGFGARLALVLILMLASAVAGAYGYRYFDGRAAVRDAEKVIEAVDISDYDTAEQTVIQDYIDGATKDLESAKTRKEVYEILTEFSANVENVKTSDEKKLEVALNAAEEAKKAADSDTQKSSASDSKSSSSSASGSTGSSGSSNSKTDSDSTDSSSYKSNELSTSAAS